MKEFKDVTGEVITSGCFAVRPKAYSGVVRLEWVYVLEVNDEGVYVKGLDTKKAKLLYPERLCIVDLVRVPDKINRQFCKDLP